MQLCVENNNIIYEISGMCTDISFKDSFNDGASTLEFSYIYDGELMLKNGDVVRLTNTSAADGIFFGKIFKVSMDESRKIKVKAYDQLRYGKAKDIITVKAGQDNIATLTDMMCSSLNLKAGSHAAVSYNARSDMIKYQDTWLDILYDMILETLTNTGEWYRLADVYGEVKIENLRDLQLPLVIGDNSLATGYSWEKSIDDEFYNIIKISWMDEASGKAQTYQEYDQNSVNLYGNLLYYEHADTKNSQDAEKLKDKAKKLLQLYNYEKESIKLNCIGDHSVRAGCSIYGSVADIALHRRVIVNSVTHKYLPTHTMELEVIAN